MNSLHASDLMSLEVYDRERARFRSRVMAHKAPRRVPIGPDATLYFEDRLTIQYQVQEMLRAERIFQAEGIAEELAAYNPLIPNGSNLKATFMIEYPDAELRQRQLAALRGIEDRVWIETDGHPQVFGIADEDLERATPEKTSAVHFLRFELPPAAAQALRDGGGVTLGIDHPAYVHAAVLGADSVTSLARDLASVN